MKIKFLLPLILLFTLSTYSQGNKDKWEKIKALKVSFITTQLNLNSEESAKFWPVYNAYEDKQFSIKRDKMRSLAKELDQKGIDKISDKEALSYIERFQDADEELLNLRKQLVKDLIPIIGPVKVLKLKQAEDDFNRRLLHKYKDNKQ